MIYLTKPIVVTDHAMKRFAQRVGERGLATLQDVEKIVMECKVIKKGDLLPFVRQQGTTYLHHQALGCYFFMDGHRVVTVTFPGTDKNHVLPKSKHSHNDLDEEDC